MRFTPDYTVSYHHAFHAKGVTFDIDDADAEEMSKYGSVEFVQQMIPGIEDTTVPDDVKQTEPVKRRGRRPANAAVK